MIIAKDFSCLDDFDDRFSLTDERGLAVMDIYHRLTNDTVCSIDPDDVDANEYGKDVTKLVGHIVTKESAAAEGPLLSGVLQRSDRIDTADVTVELLEEEEYALKITIEAVTMAGPLRLVVGVSELSAALLEVA
jgi:hypothetical protein